MLKPNHHYLRNQETPISQIVLYHFIGEVDPAIYTTQQFKVDKKLARWSDICEQIIEAYEFCNIFIRVNKAFIDEDQEGMVVPLTCIKFYAEQIHNLTDEVDYNRALETAKLVAEIAKRSKV